MSASKRVILKVFFAFIVIVLALAFFSNTIYNYNSPCVSVSFPTEGIIASTINGYGEVQLPTEHNYFSPIDGIVTLYNSESDIIKKDEPLFTITPDQQYIDELLFQKNIDLELIELDIEQVNIDLDYYGDIGSSMNEIEYKKIVASLENKLSQLNVIKKSLENYIESINISSTSITIYAEENCKIINHIAEERMFVSKHSKILSASQVDDIYIVDMDLGNGFLEVGKFVYLSVASKGMHKIDGVVEAVMFKDNSSFAKISFKAEGLTGGEAVELKIENASQRHKYIIPNSAIGIGGGNYTQVLVVERKKNTFGYEYITKSISAHVIEYNDTHSAVDMLEYTGQPIIINSDRPVYDGMRVKLADGSDYDETR